MTQARPISVVVANFNGARHLPATLAAIGRHAGHAAEILLVDDASSDHGTDLAAELNPAIRILRRSWTGGPGAVRNEGFAAAAHDLILMLDNDVRIEESTIPALAAALEAHPKALLATPRVVHDHDPGVIQYESADCHFLGLMAPRHAERPAEETPRTAAATASLVTCCFLIDRRRWQGGPPFDESFGFNYEDHDFGLRARLCGHELRSEPDALVRHGSGTQGLSLRSGGTPSTRRLFYLIRNRWLIVAQIYQVRTLVLLAPAFILFEVSQALMLLARGMGGVWWQALRSFIGRRSQTARNRRTIQGARLHGDGAILSGGPLPLQSWLRLGPLKGAALFFLEILLDLNWRLARPFLADSRQAHEGAER